MRTPSATAINKSHLREFLLEANIELEGRCIVILSRTGLVFSTAEAMCASPFCDKCGASCSQQSAPSRGVMHIEHHFGLAALLDPALALEDLLWLFLLGLGRVRRVLYGSAVGMGIKPLAVDGRRRGIENVEDRPHDFNGGLCLGRSHEDPRKQCRYQCRVVSADTGPNRLDNYRVTRLG